MIKKNRNRDRNAADNSYEIWQDNSVKHNENKYVNVFKLESFEIQRS